MNKERNVLSEIQLNKLKPGDLLEYTEFYETKNRSMIFVVVVPPNLYDSRALVMVCENKLNMYSAVPGSIHRFYLIGPHYGVKLIKRVGENNE